DEEAERIALTHTAAVAVATEPLAHVGEHDRVLEVDFNVKRQLPVGHEAGEVGCLHGLDGIREDHDLAGGAVVGVAAWVNEPDVVVEAGDLRVFGRKGEGRYTEQR